MAVPASRKLNGSQHRGKPTRVAQNRMKRERRPLNIRGFLKKGARVAGGLVVATLAGVIGYEAYSLIARTSFFKLERIEVSALKRLSREDVIDQAGIKVGDDLLRLRLGRMGEQLAKNPWIEKVRIRRYLPHTIAIEVVEQEPVAVASMGYLYYLNAKGEIFKPLMEGDRLDFPIFTGINEEELAKDPAGTKEAIKAMLEIVALLRKGAAFKLEDVSEIHYDKGYGFTLFTVQRGVPVRLGRTDFVAKLERLARIYGTVQAQMQTLEYIDLDYNDKIVVKTS